MQNKRDGMEEKFTGCLQNGQPPHLGRLDIVVDQASPHQRTTKATIMGHYNLHIRLAVLAALGEGNYLAAGLLLGLRRALMRAERYKVSPPVPMTLLRGMEGQSCGRADWKENLLP